MSPVLSWLLPPVTLRARATAYVAALPDGAPIVFVVGAMAHGRVDVSYTDDFISVSEFPLSAACCLGRICNALEAKFDIV